MSVKAKYTPVVEAEPTIEEMTEHLTREDRVIVISCYRQHEDEESWLAELKGFPSPESNRLEGRHVLTRERDATPDEALRALYLPACEVGSGAER